MKPIPLSALCHSVALLSGITTDRFQNETVGSETTIRNVRVSPSSKRISTKDNTQVTLSALLFVDMQHSKPIVSFSEADRIVFQGTSYRIVEIKPVYDFNQIHHYEIGLIL